MYAPNDYPAIAAHIGTKEAYDVEKYSLVFFTRIDSLADADKIKKNMEKADKLISFKQKAPEIIKKKVMAYESPLDEMIIYAS